MLAVAGGKGGCGKTTTTLGLALAAGRWGRSVLAVDADLNVPDLHRVVGLEGVPATEPPDRDRPVAAAASGDRRAPTHGPDTAAPVDPVPVPGQAGVAVLPGRPAIDPVARCERLPGLAADRDLVVLDCPAGAGRDAVAPLRAADRTIVVSTAERPSLADAAKTAAMSRAVGTPVAGAVITRADRPPSGLDALLGAPSQWPCQLSTNPCVPAG